MIFLRIAAVAYWFALSVVLLVPDPGRLLGWEPHLVARADTTVHFTAFALLGFSIFLAGLPVRLWIIIPLMLAYAVGIEMLQHFFPPRTVDMRDLAANLLGLAAGAIVYVAVRAMIRGFRRWRYGPQPANAEQVRAIRTMATVSQPEKAP